MEKSFVIFIFKNLNSQLEPAIQITVQLLHDERRNVLMRHPVGKDVFQRMRKRSMPDIVQQNGKTSSRFFFSGNFNTFITKFLKSQSHQVISPQRVGEARMHSP